MPENWKKKKVTTVFQKGREGGHRELPACQPQSLKCDRIPHS